MPQGRESCSECTGDPYRNPTVSREQFFQHMGHTCCYYINAYFECYAAASGIIWNSHASHAFRSSFAHATGNNRSTDLEAARRPYSWRSAGRRSEREHELSAYSYSTCPGACRTLWYSL